MEYHFKIHKEKKGYWAEGIELDNCTTQGDNLDELDKNMSEALNLLLDEPLHSNVIFPMPRPKLKGRNVRAVPVEPQIAFAMMLRQERLHEGLTQKEAATKLGLKNLYSYQRLESSKTANPALSTLVKIKSIFPKLNLEMVI